ncbi:DNA polymerase II [Granulosicoccus antarcticus IMCC3135]|uniref:DNA polymerase n=2 Tax=Granulosicoccus TaxID=437504 RepID=A0A2Z2P4D0_9GAMM|nr:DNA polymerase II [Granulosicoccus antarcticus IMCC3135]
MSLDAYLLTRHWRDTPQGLELSLWACSDQGPVHLIIRGQQAVCFIERSVPVSLPSGTLRKPLELTLLHGEAVDGLYFRQQRDLQQLRQSDLPLCESDIKPVDRYLMERFIRAPIRIEGTVEAVGNHYRVRQPRLLPGNYQPQLRTVAIDIETRGRSRTLYSVAAAIMPSQDISKDASQDVSEDAPADVVFMIGQAQDEMRDGYKLIYKSDEKTLLNAFFDWIIDIDPDALTGWAVVNFDLNFMDQKCQALGIPFRLGRGGETAAVLQPGNPGSPRIARVPGRAVFDGIDLLKAGFWSFDSFSLDNVSHELLGTGKLITAEQDKVAEINRLFRDDKPQLADYNIRDCTLVNEIFIKADLLAFAIQRANLTGLALDRLGGSVAAFDNLYLPRLHRAGFVAPDVNNRSNTAGSPGGYVMDSVPGLYKNILVLDFKSLYPSIIRTFFIDPMGLAVPGENPVPGFVEATFSREQHILPGLIEELWAARDEAKQHRNAPLSQAIKIIMNSFYGVLGTTGCRFYSQQLVSSITRRGHEIITRSRDWIEEQGYPVIYGDTDSLFVLVGEGRDAQACAEVGNSLMQALNLWWTEELSQRFGIASHLEVEYETHYSRFFMPTVRGMPTGSKKRYAGLIEPDSVLIVKGLEAARTDWTPLARNFQRELFRRVFLDLPFDEFVRTTAEQLRAGELDEQLVYRKRIRRALDDYQRNVPPHIQAARKLPHSGRTISYLITRNGPEPLEKQESAPDYQHYLDKQLAPAADGILQFLDTSFSAITDAQLQMF